MVSNMYVIVFAVLYYGSTVESTLICRSRNPIDSNGTEPPDEVLCPQNCRCTYFAPEDNSMEYTHNVNCSYIELKTIPSLNTVPIDVQYYLLSHNKIEALKSNSFKSLRNLEHLELNTNSLTHKNISTDAFRGLRNLTYLSLNYNPHLGKVHAEWFQDLVSLEILHLSNGRLTTIESNAFINCKKLKTIELTTNRLVNLPTNLFQNLPVLKFLYLNENVLITVPNKAFKGSNKLQNISIDYNHLSTLSENIGFQQLRHLQAMSISNNPFTCDCKLLWFRNWIEKINVTLGLQNAKCLETNTKLIDFDPRKLHCNKLINVLKIFIPSAAGGIVLVIIASILYYFKHDLRYWKQRRRLRRQYERLNREGPLPINGENIRYDVFVAYSNKDQRWVLKFLQPSLEVRRNFKLCIDYRDFVPGEAVVNNIANAVKYSRKVMLIVSKNFAKSEWCYFELEMARMRMFDNHENILVIVLLEKVLAKDMPILLHKILTEKTYIEWEEQPERQALFWTKLEVALLSPNCPRNRLLDNKA